MAKRNSHKQTNGSDLDFDGQLWSALDKLRAHNQLFNMNDWGGENLRHDVRWKFGCRGRGGIRHGERFSVHADLERGGEIRKALIEADLAKAITTN